MSIFTVLGKAIAITVNGAEQGAKATYAEAKSTASAIRIGAAEAVIGYQTQRALVKAARSEAPSAVQSAKAWTIEGQEARDQAFPTIIVPERRLAPRRAS